MQLSGIGKLATSRLAQYNITTITDLDNYIITHSDADLRKLVRDISLNERRGRCLEGYVPRRYNKRIYDGLVGRIREHRDFQIDDYGTWRVSNPDRKVLQCGSSPRMVSWNPETGVADRGTIVRQGYPWVRGRYFKSCMLPEGLSNVERDRLIRNSFAYKARRKYPCSCFQSEKTCRDFSPSRGNRLRGSRLSYCEWSGGECRSVL